MCFETNNAYPKVGRSTRMHCIYQTQGRAIDQNALHLPKSRSIFENFFSQKIIVQKEHEDSVHFVKFSNLKTRLSVAQKLHKYK